MLFRSKKHWNATVTALKSAHVHPSRAATARERERSSTNPNAAHPSTFGTKNAQNPGQPHSRSRMNGRYIPMHHVQLEVQNRPHWMDSRVRRTEAV